MILYNDCKNFFFIRKLSSSNKFVEIPFLTLTTKDFFLESFLNIDIFFFNYILLYFLKKNFLLLLSMLRFSTNFLKKMSYLNYLNYNELHIFSIKFYKVEKYINIFSNQLKTNIEITKKSKSDNKEIYAALIASYGERSIEDTFDEYFDENENYLNLDDKVYL